MNKERRKQIDKALALIYEANEILEEVKGDEESALENLPESLQEGERGQAMQEAIDNLDNALSCICDISENLESAKGE